MDVLSNATLAEGVERTVAPGGNYLIYTLTSVDPAAIDAMLNEHIQNLSIWSHTQPLAMMHYFPIQQQAFITPYVRERLTHFTRTVKQSGVPVYCAIVIPDKKLFHRAHLSGFMRLQHIPNSRQRYFTEYDEATVWLTAQLL